MAQSRPLDVVIRRVERGTRSEDNASKLVVIDVRKKKAVPKPPLLGETRYYLVSNTGDARNWAECKGPACAVPDFATGREISVRVDYQARCKPGNEEKAAEALFEKSHPALALDGLIEKWVTDFTHHRPGEFIDNYYERRSGLQQHIQARAEVEVGLTLQVKLTLEGEESLSKVRVGPTTFEVQLKDYDKEQKLEAEVELLVDEARRIDAVLALSREARLERLVFNVIGRHLADQVTFHQFCTALRTDDFKEQLRRPLDDALRGWGRRVGRISLNSPAAGLVAEDFFEFEHDVVYKIQEFPQPVTIKNSLQMVLTDVARYQAGGPSDIGEWIKRSLERVVHEELFKKKYIDLLLKFKDPADEETNGRREAAAPGGDEERISTRIKKKMKARAEAIGYSLKQLTTAPDLAPYRLLENFTINADRTYATKRSDVHVRLRIVVVARIDDLEDVKDYLNRLEDVPRAMEEAVVAVASQYLREIDPSDFYMHFSFPKESQAPTVEETIIERVKERLTERFKARIASVVPSQLEDELVERLRLLRRELRAFTITVEPLYSGEVYVFEGAFQVRGVHGHGWYTFQSRSATIEEVKATIEKSVGAYLATQPDERLRLTMSDSDELRHEVEAEVNKLLLEGYGLVVGINALFRHRTSREVMATTAEDAYAKETLKGMLDKIDMLERIRESNAAQMARLLERREEIITSEESDAELSEIDRKIVSVQEQLELSQKRIEQQVLKARNKTLPRQNRRALGSAGRARAALPAAPARAAEDHDGGEVGE